MAKTCIKCNIILNKKNWIPSRQKNNHYICNNCGNIQMKELKQNIKFRVINHYGGLCTCCKEKNIAFLTIDHIDGSGAEHRRYLKKIFKRKKDIGSSDFYRWLEKNNYPKDNYQILCFNCNCAKHILGICPHQKKK